MTKKPRKYWNAIQQLFTTDPMKQIKIFVRPDNTATIICPSCSAVKKISVEPFKHKKHLLQLRCKCGERFAVQLDFRKFYRKSISLPGTFRVVKPAGGGGGVIHIRNLSLGGIGFTVSGVHHIERGQTLQLDFTLNDKHQSKIRKQAVVQTINQNYIGCRFIDSQVTDKALGFYLRP